MSYRGELRAQLVAGQITEACAVAQGRIGNFLPRTLGLEVIRYEPCIYDTRGIVRTPPERGQVTRQLASEDRRLALEGPRYRVEPFAERAITSTARPAVRDFYVDGALTDSQLNERYRLLRNYCLGAFPDKSFHLSREDARRLRSVRATRGIR